MAEGTVPILIEQLAIENVAKANAALEKTLKLILEVNKASRGGSGGSTPNDAEKINTANKASTERLKLADQTLVMQKKLVQSEINLKNALKDENKEIIKNRTELTQTNKKLKDSALLTSKLTGAYQKQSIKLNQLRKRYKDVATAEGVASKNAKKLRLEVIKLDAKLKKVDKSAGQFQRNVGNYTKAFGGLKSMLFSVVGAFGIFEAIRFGVGFIKDAAAVAREAKGVEFAFKNLGDTAQKAFGDVKASTRGLLSDLAIKKNIILFDNFNISLEQMGDLMQFAAVRSAQTGESMEHLASSIATGLGRESVLILDNLGINTKELRNLMDELGVSMTEAFSILASREVAEAGNILDEATNSQEKFNAAFENFQVAAGSGFIGDLTNNINDLGTALLNTVSDINEVSDGFFEFFGNLGLLMGVGGVGSLSADASASRALKIKLDLLSQISEIRIKEAKQNGIILTQAQVDNDLQGLNNKQLREMLSLLSGDGGGGITKKTVAFYQSVISETKALRDSTATTNEEYRSFTKTIEDAEIAIAKLMGTYKSFQKAQSTSIAKGRKSTTTAIDGGITTSTDIIEKPQEAGDNPISALQIVSSEEFDLALQNFDQLTELGNTLLDRKLAQIDAEIRAEEDKYNMLFALSQGDAEQQRLLAIEREESLQKLEAKRRKEQKKQAIFNKAQALINIGINTAVAVTKVGAETGLLGLSLAPFIIALGAAQASIVLSTPIPAYAKGGTTDSDGNILVGDGGQKEVVKTPDGNLFVTPSTNTIIDVPKGTEIYPSIDKFNAEVPTDMAGKIYNASIMASLTLQNNNKNAERVLNEKLLEAMLENNSILKKQKLTVRNNMQRIDIADELYKMKYD